MSHRRASCCSGPAQGRGQVTASDIPVKPQQDNSRAASHGHLDLTQAVSAQGVFPVGTKQIKILNQLWIGHTSRRYHYAHHLSTQLEHSNSISKGTALCFRFWSWNKIVCRAQDLIMIKKGDRSSQNLMQFYTVFYLSSITSNVSINIFAGMI